ncbi:MAG: DUF6062 family protein [Acutalibacteraceae bacterium]
MRDDICTIPVSEVFEVNDGCPICRMRDTIEERMIEYILGDAMMEPDVRIETNKVGFCEYHYGKMMSRRGRLQLALMLQTHINEINDNIFKKKLFNTDSKKEQGAKRVGDSCFICSKIEWGMSRLIDTVYRCYENERDFRDMFNNQTAFCLPHYERLLSGASKKNMRSYGGEFADNLNRITAEYSKKLYADLSKYCTMYDYRSKENTDWGDSRDAVERTVAFLNGRSFKSE